MTRETLKCPSCGLNQFVNAAETYKRCKRAMRPAEAPEPAREAGRPPGVQAFMLAERVTLAGSIALEIRAQRMAMVNVSQRELARRINCERTYVSKVENNQALPGIPSLQRFAAAFGVPIWQILKNAEEAMRQIAYECRSCKMTLTEDEFKVWVGCDVCDGESLVMLGEAMHKEAR